LILVLLIVQPDLLLNPSDLGTRLEQLLTEFVVALVAFGDGHLSFAVDELSIGHQSTPGRGAVTLLKLPLVA